MDYSEILIGQAQLMVALGGFAALLLAFPTEGEDDIHSGWGVRALIIQAIFSACVSLSGLFVLSSDLALSEIWRISSAIYIFLWFPGVLLSSWDIRRIHILGIRAKSALLYWLCWLLGVAGLGLNGVNMIIEEPAFSYFYWGLATNAFSGFVLFAQNVFLFTNDPGQYDADD